MTALEKLCLVLSGLGILCWAATGSPRIGLIASICASLIGGIPTMIKAWKEPWTETVSGWSLMLLGTLFSTLAIHTWTFDSVLLHVAFGAFQISIILPLVLYGKCKNL